MWSESCSHILLRGYVILVFESGALLLLLEVELTVVGNRALSLPLEVQRFIITSEVERSYVLFLELELSIMLRSRTFLLLLIVVYYYNFRIQVTIIAFESSALL